mgnify:CR=1 FL=1
MKILLISPWDKRRRRYRTISRKLIAYPPLTLPMVAALIPPELNAEITVFDEMSDKKLPSGHFDIVGITVITSESKRAYELADHYSEQGSFVVLGGYHVTFMPQEALSHADSIVTREADEAWPALLRDFSAGRAVKQVYEGGQIQSKVVIPNRSILRAKNYCLADSIIASRGCRNRCSFCSISRMSSYMNRDTDDVIEELKMLKHRIVIFYDPNFFSNKEYALALMKKMEPLKLHWGATATVDFGFDKELLSAAQKSGCTGVLIGFETMNRNALKGVNKNFCDPARYGEAIENIHRHGMSINGTFVLGLDSDREEDLVGLPERVRCLGIDIAIYFTMTPTPGTDLYKQMKDQGRILTEDWSRFTQADVVFRPQNMSPERLQALYHKIWRETYSIRNIFRRVMHAPGKSFLSKLTVIVMNIGFKFMGRDKPVKVKE